MKDKNLVLMLWIVTGILWSGAVVHGQQLSIEMFTRPSQDSNIIRLLCRETLLNNTEVRAKDIGFFYFNDSQQVMSLLEAQGIPYEFSQDGILKFVIEQRIEGMFYCSHRPNEKPSSSKLILARPRPRQVKTYHERAVGESVTLRSGVGEGALAGHYTAYFYKNSTHFTNVSRGDDFSLTLTSLQLSDSGIYTPVVRILTGNGDIYLVQNLSPITLAVYQSPIIEVAPSSVIDNEGAVRVSFTCVATGGPHLRLSWFREGKNITKYTPSQCSINNTVLNEGTKVLSVLTIQRPNYTDSGKYKCFATIMDGRDGNKFRAQETADLTILESKFLVKIAITKLKQILLWVRLQNPINPYPVTAIVYFTPAANPHQEPLPVPTYSIVGNTTLMIFQLETHDVPQKFQNNDFYVQVALRVKNLESALVPKSLDTAIISNLNEPTTSEECIQQETNILAAIIVSGAVILLVVGFSIYFLCYKYNKYHLKKQKTVTQATAEGSQWLQASQEPREDINDA